VTRLRWAPALAAAALLAGADDKGCKADREVPVRVVASGAMCGGGGAGVSARRITSAEDLAAAVQEAASPSADFAKEAVVLVSAGQKTTAGYGIALASERAPVKDGVAGLRVTLTSPAAGMMSAQVMTSPCLVLALPAEGLLAVGVVEGDRPVAKVALR
jgi:hypothetical protein